MTKDLVVGIDLGTTNTVAAIFTTTKNGKVLKILENNEGGYTTPSFILFPQKNEEGKYQAIVGKVALGMSLHKPERGIHDVKRLMGKQFHEVKSLLKYLSYELRENNSGEPTIFIEDDLILKPIEVSSIILGKIKDDVSKKLGGSVTKAVITVPAHFTVSQRKATLEAAKMANFEVLKLLNEPSAAALTYFYDDIMNSEEEELETNVTTTEKKRILVYDLGGGTFDVAILERNKNNIDIIAIDGDSHLGGHDFDNIILDYVCNEIQQKHRVDLRKSYRDLRRLKGPCKKAKEYLSTNGVTETPVTVDALHFNISTAEVNLTKMQFEHMCNHLFQRTINIVDACINCAKLSKHDIDEIILAGGSTRIPKIQEMLKEYFGKEPKTILHPEECVAKGAALQAAMLSKSSKQSIKELKITEVTSSSLGIGEVAHKMDFLIRRNTPIPTKASVLHTTVFDQQKSIALKIYEGERLDTRKNICLGNFKITDLTPAPPGKCKIKIMMEIDINGILTVTAEEKAKDNTRELQIAYTKVNRSGDAIQNDAISFKEDERFAETAKMNEFLIIYCEMVKYNIKDKKLMSQFKHIYDKCDEVQKQILLPVGGPDEKKLAMLGKGLLRMCAPLIKKYGFKKIPTSSEIQRKLENVESDDEEETPFQVHKKYEEKSKFKFFGRK